MRLVPTILTSAEYKAMGDKAVADGFWRNDKRIFLPGMGWYCDWELQEGRGFQLSVHYNRDWRGKRPPICVVCPNGSMWNIDHTSSNGDGWQVTGEWPNITCSPSIIAGDYHGFLRGGEFTPDLDGKTFPIPNVGPDYGRK